MKTFFFFSPEDHLEMEEENVGGHLSSKLNAWMCHGTLLGSSEGLHKPSYDEHHLVFKTLTLKAEHLIGCPCSCVLRCSCVLHYALQCLSI